MMIRVPSISLSQPGSECWTRVWAALILAVWIVAGWGAGAQTAPAAGAIRTIDPERLYEQSLFAQRVLGEVRAKAFEIRQANSRMQAMLEAEEQELTDQRSSLDPAAFRSLADAFDEKVVAIRASQAQQEEALKDWARVERNRFFQVGEAVLATMMEEEEIAILLDARTVLMAAPGLDMTTRALTLMDAALGNGAEDAPPIALPGTEP